MEKEMIFSKANPSLSRATLALIVLVSLCFMSANASAQTVATFDGIGLSDGDVIADGVAIDGLKFEVANNLGMY